MIVSNSLDPDQARHFVRPDFGLNCLQTVSVDDSSRHSLLGKLFICGLLLFFFSKSFFFFENSFRNTIIVSNSLDPDQA